MIRTTANEVHTKHVSRTCRSQFEVSANIYDDRVRRMFCLVVNFLFKFKLENRQGTYGKIKSKEINRRILQKS